MTRRTSKKGHIIASDGDGHYYLIERAKSDTFNKWVEATSNGDDWEGVGFDDCRIDGPHRLVIHEWEELS